MPSTANDTTGNDPGNPNGRKVVDAIWNFGYRDEIRKCVVLESLIDVRIEPYRRRGSEDHRRAIRCT